MVVSRIPQYQYQYQCVNVNDERYVQTITVSRCAVVVVELQLTHWTFNLVVKL